MQLSSNIISQSAVVLGLLGLAIGHFVSNELSQTMAPRGNVSIESRASLSLSNRKSNTYTNGTEHQWEYIQMGAKQLSAPLRSAVPTEHRKLRPSVATNIYSKPFPPLTRDHALEIGELEKTIERLLIKPSRHPLHKLTLKISQILYQVGLLGKCSVASPRHLQDLIFKVINYVALGASLHEGKGDERTMEKHPVREVLQLFDGRSPETNCIQHSGVLAVQKRLELLLQGLMPAMKNRLWDILSNSPFHETSKKFQDLKEFGAEFFRHLCWEGLQNSDDINEFCGNTAPLNSTVYGKSIVGEKRRRKRFAHPDDKVLDKLFRRAGYGHGHGHGYGHGHYEKPAEPEIVIIEDDDDKKDDKKLLFIPKILLTIGTYILLCLLSLKAFFLSHAGAKGDKGEPGMDGEKGDKGLKGFPGHKGKRGFPGMKGDRGDPGMDGLPGEKGEKGFPGEVGYPGEKGHPGEKGDTGEKGEKGAKGQKGQRGKPGHRGPRGPRGRPAFHSSHRKKRELDEPMYRFEHNQTDKIDALSHANDERHEQLSELSHRTRTFNTSNTDNSFRKVPVRVMGPSSERHSKNSNPEMTKATSSTGTAETRSMLKADYEITDPSVFPLGPERNSLRKIPVKISGHRVLEISETAKNISGNEEKVSHLFQQLRLLSPDQNTLNANSENEFIVSAMNELWRIYETPNGCIQCRLFDFLTKQPSMDLDSYIIAGFAHVLGETESFQLLDLVRRAKAQKKTLRCIQYDVTKCKIESLNTIQT